MSSSSSSSSQFNISSVPLYSLVNEMMSLPSRLNACDSSSETAATTTSAPPGRLEPLTHGSNIYLRDPDLSLVDINDFIHKWRAGEFSQVETVTLIYSWRMPSMTSVDALFWSLPMYVWIPENRPQYHGHVNCAFGVDVERVDGTRATIHATQTKIQFLVWTEKFMYPNGRKEDKEAEAAQEDEEMKEEEENID